MPNGTTLSVDLCHLCPFCNSGKKIEEKLSNLAIEIASIQKNIIIYPNENNYKNLHISKTKELNSLYNELEAAKGKDYLNEFISKLSNEYKKYKRNRFKFKTS